MAYYYLIASLPTLHLDEKLPISRDEFLAACENTLTLIDIDDIMNILDRKPERGKHPVIRNWLWREIQLRNAIARERAAKANVDAEPFQRPYHGFDTYTEKIAAEAMSKPNPLERELILDKFRWKTIEELALYDPYGMQAVIAFAFKFTISERWAGLVAEKGEAVVQAFLEQALTDMTHE